MAIEDVGSLPGRGRLVIDTAPIIYVLEDHPAFAPRFMPVFERAEAGDYELVITTTTLAEVLVGPLRRGDESLAREYRDTLTSPPAWHVVDLTAGIAHRAARIRGRTGLRLPDAVQVATAIETASMGLVTHDRDFAALDRSPERVAVWS